MPKVVWLPEALEDIARLHAFLKDQNPLAARNAMLCVRMAGQQLEQWPEMGRPMPDRLRREIFVAFGAGGYVLRYRLNEAGQAVVLRVWHSREDRE